ncbi:MAG: glutamate synthase large subunit [Bacteroidia bacterium]|nr:glutamate synthase large subunit [Bacteroidia bacterium]
MTSDQRGLTVSNNPEHSLYHPSFEHDACGIGFVAHLKGEKSHQNVADALLMLENMEHRGACGYDPQTGDGAGILIQVPDRFFRELSVEMEFHLPEFGKYGVGVIFFPKDQEQREEARLILNKTLQELGFSLLAYRKLPTLAEEAQIGASALEKEPQIEHLFLKGQETWDKETLERKLFILRRVASHTINRSIENIGDDFYIASISYKTIIYKGQFRTDQVGAYFPDLQDERVESALALVHSRFSTNTFPKWRLAQPFRYIAHNGEINTIKGNVNWMKAKEFLMESPLFTREEMAAMQPICDPKQSDSRNLDSIVEFLVMSGRSLPHVMMMLIPEAWQGNEQMDPVRKAFYEYHATLMEPWDGPASICFTDGNIVGATLDRNGLRPSRYAVTSDDRLIMSSEAGALKLDPEKVIKKGRLQPGKIFVADLSQGRIISDEELKADICSRKPYQEWLDEHKETLANLPKQNHKEPYAPFKGDILQQQQLFGITSEELKVVLGPMGKAGKEPIGSMGSDTPLAALSDQSQHISNYFKQLFAQVSNPPIDPIREKMVMSLQTWIGGAKNVLAETPQQCKHIAINNPVLSNSDLHKIRHINHRDYMARTVDLVFGLDEKLEDAIKRICKEAHDALKRGANILIMSDRKAGEKKAPVPALMAAAAIHHYLIKENIRHVTALIVESADVREVHHFATLIGYGSIAVNPYLAFDSLSHLQKTHPAFKGYSEKQLHKNYTNAIQKGLLKVFSKMGISTLQSYHGAQIFEILGLHKEVVDTCFSGSISRISGLGFEELAKEILVRHKLAYPQAPVPLPRLEVGGVYQWKRMGEAHLFNPETIHLLQHSSKKNDYQLYKKYANKINQQMEKAITLRSLLDFTERTAVPIEEVESVEDIMKRFATGAMSFGSISHEAHSTLAIAMNRIGAKSNSGEGGEDPIRFQRKSNGDWERSAIKQVASGRFGVTSFYLSNAEELQIKMAQGAKPGEGGQLPGHKVDAWIGRVRHATPGVGLISPPPHHDIYSIEDLAQLIFDLKNANRAARISVKLVSEAGVGTIAAGVAKAHADHILISGHDGGTGASPLSSVRHAGLPWELGLAEAHQTLVKNKLRSRVRIQTDGQIRTGRDIAIATLLGAEEWGVATAALIVEGCIMMRKCHLNTCPVGVATQDPNLRKLFTGKPEDVINFFTFLAIDFREHMAMLGFRSVDEMVGQADVLKMRDNISNWKARTLDLSPVLYKEPNPDQTGLYKSTEQDHGLAHILDHQLIEKAIPAMESLNPIFESFEIENTDRAVGTMLSNEISKRFKDKGLKEATLHYKFYGSAGQSFAAFSAKGIRFELEGEANDYLGKGLSGSQIIVYPPKISPFEPSKNILIGNVAFYGATSGEAFIRGIAGERFCVRNSGVKAVVEGVGDHGCEYMTGGVAIILGKTGRNFAAGMSGGTAFIYDPDNNFEVNCNKELVDLDPLSFEDKELLKSMIDKHYTFTGSRRALKLITDWEEAFRHFVKVMPRDYKAVLNAGNNGSFQKVS